PAYRPPSRIHVVVAKRLAPHDLPGTLDGVGVVDPVASVADLDLAAPLVMLSRPAGTPERRCSTGLAPGRRTPTSIPPPPPPGHGLGDDLPPVARTEPTALCGGSTTILADARRRRHLG